jgi:phosphoribosyl 1,2-cyclic phosphodiesterase
MRVVSLGSGSSGNALFVEAGPQGRTRLLVDAGLSARTIVQRLQTIGVSPLQLSGILVTHEHSDHVQGIPVLMRRYAVPIIADTRTLAAIDEGIKTGTWRTDTGKIVAAPNPPMVNETVDLAIAVSETQQVSPDANASILVRSEATIVTTLETGEATAVVSDPNPLFIPFPIGSQRLFGDIEVTSFATSHDAVAPCGYLLHAGGCRVCIVTDSGEVTLETRRAMRRADLLILESNHDRERLIRGPYPWSLKKRILSSSGHLSNDQAAHAVRRAWSLKGTHWLWLAHLSRTNNTPSLAIDHMRTHLQNAGINLSRMTISALPPGMGEVWDSQGLWQK